MSKETYDLNGDGKVTEKDIRIKSEQIDLENRDRKEDAQRKMAWIAMISMLIFTLVLFTPLLSPDRVAALSDLLGMFYIAQAGIVAAFFGAQAYMTINRI